MNNQNAQLWIESHEKHLIANYPHWPTGEAAKRAAQAASRFSIASQGYSKEGPAIKATCKELGIKQTYKAIFEFFGAEKAAPVPKAPTISKEEALERAQAARQAKVLTKKINSSRYERILPLSQFIRCLVEEGAKVVQLSTYKNKRGTDIILVRGLQLEDRFWGENQLTKLGVDFAAGLINGRA